LKILIAEDELPIRVMLEKLCRKWEFEPVIAVDGQEALEIIQSDEAPQLILLDWEMPKLNGVDVCKLIRDKEKNSASPRFVMLLTARTNIDDVVEAFKAGANEYIAKPFENADLHARLNVARRFIELQNERDKTEQSLELFKRIYESTQEGIMVTDANLTILDVNPAFCLVTGYRSEEVIGSKPDILNSGRHDQDFYQSMWKVISETGHWQGEIWNKKKSGEIYAELLTISVINNENDEAAHYVGIFSDITETKKLQTQLQLMAHYDTLTGLPNRSLFMDRLNQGLRHCNRSESKLALAFLDLDSFKQVNDNFGHESGDKLLIEVANRIKHELREEDTVSRHGGDEFTLLLNDIADLTSCETLLERILDTLSRPFMIDGHEHNISASIGMTVYPDDMSDINTLLKHADEAMYQAKLEGKNRYQTYQSNDEWESEKNS
jgi:diguanylate cyclase (GGDEF)-like protein/PAS domain S-box-containing protein